MTVMVEVYRKVTAFWQQIVPKTWFRDGYGSVGEGPSRARNGSGRKSMMTPGSLVELSD